MATHGMCFSPTWKTWYYMKARCRKDKLYKERGIKVCDRWQKFENFYADMGLRPDGMSIDRIDNSGNYEPGNCRWATPMQQQQNTRRNVYLEFNGERHVMSEWARRLGVHSSVILYRLRRGWSVERTLTEPVKQRTAP